MTTTPLLPRPDAHWREWVTYGLSWAKTSLAPTRTAASAHTPTADSVSTRATGTTAASVPTSRSAASAGPTTPLTPATAAAPVTAAAPATRAATASTPATRAPAIGATNWTSDDNESLENWRAATRDAASTRLQSWPITFYAYREEVPGPRWQALWEATQTAYRAFYCRDGVAQRPTLQESQAALAEHMPELVPTYERLVRLTRNTPADDAGTEAGDAEKDDVPARLLTMWRLPIFAAGCSQVAIGGEAPTLSRNYDYDFNLFEGVIASTNYTGTRAVLGSSDMLWGLVDGMNEDGLAISMTYGGRKGGGVGFAIPLVVRYLLEVCGTVDEACERLRGLPVAQAYNLAMVDATGARATVFIAPGEDPIVSDHAVSTNHKLDRVEHPEIADPLSSLERQNDLNARLQQSSEVTVDDVQEWLAEKPMFTDRYSSGFGTLYTVSYEPKSGTAQYRWGQRTLSRSFDDLDTEFPVVLRGR
ncbi:MAG: C45 family peptidase [Ornithinimicrobium sp.]